MQTIRYEEILNIFSEQTGKISAIQEATINAIAYMAESRDKTFTGEHLRRVQEICSILIANISDSVYQTCITNNEAYAIIASSILHDIGKVAIKDEVLNKPGKLNKEELEHMKQHVEIGVNIIEHLIKEDKTNTYLITGEEIIKYHHERWDGNGYPFGLKGLQIPLSARIMAIADVYDALRSERPYKGTMSRQEALNIIRGQGGKHFDPEIVRLFLLNEKEISSIYRVKTYKESTVIGL